MPNAASDLACPYCGKPFPRIPSRKTKCPACKNPVYAKATPDDRTKRLMTETQAMAAEAVWEKQSIDREVAIGARPADGDWMKWLRGHREDELRKYKADSDRMAARRVRIVSARDACDYCKSRSERVVPIDQAIAVRELPHVACTGLGPDGLVGYCRCYYEIVFDDE